MFPLKCNQKRIIKVIFVLVHSWEAKKVYFKKHPAKVPPPNIFRTTSDFAHLAV